MKLPSLDTIATAILAACGIYATSVLWQRTHAAARPAPREPERTLVAEWRQYGSGPLVAGPANAPVTVVVFSDFQCPFCARVAHAIQRIRRSRPTQVRMVFHNVPNTRLHPMAREAALAAICASQQGRFERMHDVLFANRDSIETGGWAWMASMAGLADANRFAACLSSPEAMRVLRADSATSARLRLTGTPTVVVNQWRLRTGAVPDSLLAHLVDSLASRTARE
jgi:protein-disulfide isomerase